MRDEELQAIRIGAELQNYAPYISDDLDKMKQSVVSSVMLLISQNNLTAEAALAKWHEYVAYERLAQRVSKKIVVGQSLGEKMPKEL